MPENEPQIKQQSVYRTVRLRVSEYEFKKFEQAQKIGYTQRAVIEQLLQTCCGSEIIIFDKEKLESVIFPKNFLQKDKKKK